MFISEMFIAELSKMQLLKLYMKYKTNTLKTKDKLSFLMHKYDNDPKFRRKVIGTATVGTSAGILGAHLATDR